jgi:arginyl-tRNA synthetase
MKQELEQAMQAAVKDLFGTSIAIELTRPDEQFGDYATNVALQLSKQVGKNPREIAEALAVKLRETLAKKLASVSVAGPGFLNLTLSDNALVNGLLSKPAQPYAGKTVVTEYSDPNIFKPLHAGHLYTTLVGDCVSRLFERAGATVVRINYGGDVGLHVGKTMWAIVRYLGGEHPEKLSEVLEAGRAAWLGARYVEGNAAYEDDEAAKQEIIAANKHAYQLHAENDYDSAFAQIYWTCRTWSYDYFGVLYEQLQVHPFERYIPESEVTPIGLQTVREQLAAGVYEESDGAVIFDGEKYGLHARVFINAAGLPTYEAKEVGLSIIKWHDYHPDLSVIITGNDITEYMKVVMKSIEQYEPDFAHVTKHLPHGNVKLAGGVKMSSRKGNVLLALDIIDAAQQAGHESGRNPSEDSILAAVKYALVKSRIGGDIIYDPKESIALEGNSGPYLQYAHARARSILAKAESAETELNNLEPAERSLLRKITEYTEVIDKAVADLMPHHICTYLYELAQTFNRFYEHNRVIDDPRQAVRLQLVTHYAETLKNGLQLLGITAPERM